MPSGKNVLRCTTRLTRSSTPTIPTLAHATSPVPLQEQKRKPSSLSSIIGQNDDTIHVRPDTPQMARYRPTAHLPEHIREHCTIYLDEQLYTSAITLLSDLVTNGVGCQENDSRPVYVPPSLHIEVVACLLVHPRYTNQAPPNEHTHLTSQAITFLRNTLAILGPINANVNEAFSLNFDETRARRRGYNDGNNEHSSSDSDERTEHMKGIIANKGRLRRCAKDFWHIVGWAFNCSIKYPARWKYWKVWLDYMIDVLELDFHDREELDKQDIDGPNLQIKQEMNPGQVPEKQLQNCLLLQYLSEVQSRKSQLPRVVRSIFAGATPKSLQDFPEVFSGETRDVKQTGQKRKRGNNFGDYNDEDDEPEQSAETTDQVSDATNSEESWSSTEHDPHLGGAETMALRQRLIRLLSRAAHFCSEDFVPVKELYDQVYLCMKDLPVPAFSLFTSPPYSSEIPAEAYVSISLLYLLRLLPNNAPLPYTVQQTAKDELSEVVLEKCYLPFPANTSSIADNARVSIQIENLLRLFLKACDWQYSAKFAAALEKGIVARENKIMSRRGKELNRKDNGDEADLSWLRGSGERLRMLSTFMKKKQRNY